MIKRYNEFIREFVESDSIIDSKMQELKDLINDVTDGHNIIYEWENKKDHQLNISFSTNELSIKYEFDIDELKLTKIAGDVVDFETEVESIDEGLDMIEKDIQSILGISESTSYIDRISVGDVLRITHPCYDDYEEGLKPEVEDIKVIDRQRDGFLVRNLEHDFTYLMRFNTIKNCQVEKIDESVLLEEFTDDDFLDPDTDLFDTDEDKTTIKYIKKWIDENIHHYDDFDRHVADLVQDALHDFKTQELNIDLDDTFKNQNHFIEMFKQAYSEIKN